MSLGLAVTPEAWYKNKREWGADYNRRDGGIKRERERERAVHRGLPATSASHCLATVLEVVP